MVEGGGTMNFELMRLGLVDELMLYIAPMIFGGATAPTPALETVSGRSSHAAGTCGCRAWEDGGVLLRYRPNPQTQNPRITENPDSPD